MKKKNSKCEYDYEVKVVWVGTIYGTSKENAIKHLQDTFLDEHNLKIDGNEIVLKRRRI